MPLASKPDVTVIGGGIFGLSCAWELTRRGARVRLREAARIGAGASGGVVGALAPHVPERWTAVKAFQFDALIAAEAFWRDVAQTGGYDPGYARTGRLQPVADDAALERAEARGAAADTLWQGKARWSLRPAAEITDWAPQTGVPWVIEDTLSARINPARACAALAAALRARGAEIAEGVTDAEDRPAAQTSILWATGAAGLGALSDAAGAEVGRGIKGQAAVLALDRRTAPQIYADGLHIVPHADGTTAVGSTTERDYDAHDATDGLLDDVIARARVAVPALGNAPVLRRWAGLRPRARSRAPLLGPWPGRPGHFVANGGFKIGFGMAPGIARVMADLVLDGEDRIPEEFRLVLPTA
ncbi:MAG: FAD-binding oxidoreductase [Pseudomonadota bacterium]